MPTVTSLHVNGTARACDAAAERTLLSVLRDDLALTGTKYGCGEGQCGACTVLLDGVPVRSCQLPCGTVGPQKITTVEGLERNGRLHGLQEALLEVGAFQCAYCASGMIMSGVALLAKNPNPSEAEIVRFMDGNVCRCGGYGRIITAIQLAATRRGKGAEQ
jgi:aerobic-type carbon monoxide dehydrogenase small subunit (CoxS/CutS family)